MRVLGVIRLSRLIEDTLSPEKQRDIINTYADRNGHTIIGWAEDLDVSGAVNPFERENLGPWLTEERAELYDALVSAKLDRLSRRIIHFAELLRWAQIHNIAVAAVDDPIDTSTPIGRLIAQIIMLFAEYELEAITERIRGTKKFMRTTKRFPGGQPPYGYWPVPNPGGDGRVLTINPETLERALEMISRIIDDNWSMGQVRDDFNKRGVLTPLDYSRARRREEMTPEQRKRARTFPLTHWTTTTVSKILRSRNLLGEVEHSGQVVRDTDGMPLQRADPLITRERFALLQAKLNAVTHPKVHENPQALLADTVFCTSCRRKIYIVVPRRKGRIIGRPQYVCSSRGNGRVCEHPARIRADRLESVLTDAFLSTIGNSERHERVWVPPQDHTEELGRVDTAMSELREEWDLGLYGTDRPGYLARLKRLSTRRAELAGQPNRPGHYAYRGLGETYHEAWQRLDQDGRRELLQATGITAHVGPAPQTQPILIDGKPVPPPAMINIRIPSDVLDRAEARGIPQPAERYTVDESLGGILVRWQAA